MSQFDFETLIEDIPDFPKPGVVFKDIMPLLADKVGYREMVDAIAEPFKEAGVTKVIGAEARGFMVGAPVAYALGAGFVPARKPGKLPRETASESYELEYGTDALEIHLDALEPGDVALIVDDLVATGGTMVAQIRLAESLGATVAGIACVMELEYLEPRKVLADATDLDLLSLVKVS